jgi:hypothetical protein
MRREEIEMEIREYKSIPVRMPRFAAEGMGIPEIGP